MRRRLLLTDVWVAAYLIGLVVPIAPLRLLALPDDLRSALWLTLRPSPPSGSSCV